MEELLAKMASLLQEIYDEGHGGEFRGSINLLLVQYNTAQQPLALDGAKSRGWDEEAVRRACEKTWAKLDPPRK